MKYIPMILLCLSFICNANDQETFLRANELYKTRDYARAVDEYSAIEKKSGIVWFNMGNAAYEQKKFGKALACWRKAQRATNMFKQGDILDNIALAKARGDEKVVAKQSAMNKVRAYGYAKFVSFPLWLIQLLALFLWILALQGLVIFLTQKLWTGRLTGTLLSLCLCGWFLGARWALDATPGAVITTQSAAVRSGPGLDFQVVGSLPETTEIITEKQSSGFYQVRTGSLVGWISSADLERI